MKLGNLLVLAGCSWVMWACGDDDSATGGGGGGTTSSTTGATSTSTATTSTTTGSTTTGQGGGPNLDKSECDGPEDCPGGECVDINGGGYHACKYPVVEATMCTGSVLDECCDTSECITGKCLAAPLEPYCGGPQPAMYNACGVDQCLTNADCTDGVCVPAGVVGNQVAMCVPAMCFGTVCGQESLSSCALVRDPCCNGPAGFICIEEDGCQSNADCPGGYCEQGVCMQGAPLCPA